MSVPPPFKKTCPCTILPPPFLNFLYSPPPPSGKVIKIYSLPFKKGARGPNYAKSEAVYGTGAQTRFGKKSAGKLKALQIESIQTAVFHTALLNYIFYFLDKSI